MRTRTSLGPAMGLSCLFTWLLIRLQRGSFGARHHAALALHRRACGRWGEQSGRGHHATPGPGGPKHTTGSRPAKSTAVRACAQAPPGGRCLTDLRTKKDRWGQGKPHPAEGTAVRACVQAPPWGRHLIDPRTKADRWGQGRPYTRSQPVFKSPPVLRPRPWVSLVFVGAHAVAGSQQRGKRSPVRDGGDAGGIARIVSAARGVAGIVSAAGRPRQGQSERKKGARDEPVCTRREAGGEGDPAGRGGGGREPPPSLPPEGECG